MIYIMGEKNNDERTAGSKARIDSINIIKERLNACELNLFSSNKFKTILSLPYNLIKFKFKLRENDIVILQYPYYSRLHEVFLKSISNKNIKIITIIHDINSLRYEKLDCLQQEIKILNTSDVLISHNRNMTQWMKKHSVIKEIIDLNLFDYIMDINENKCIKENYKIINYAGNLSKNKSGFIYNINNLKKENLEWRLYGPNYDVENDLNIYKGIFSPEELNKVISEGFGLIWDGNSIDECEGELGRYLMYNNPHKFSLYMACGVPVISWNKAAIADFINENNIGFTVDTLDEIELKLNGVTKEEYQQMTENVSYIQKKVTNGQYLYEAILKSI